MFSKKKSSKSTVKNVVTLNIFSEKNYIFKSDAFRPLKKLSYNTNNFITSYVTNKDLISTSVEISRSIAEEDIADILDIKAYEELGLDQASSYIISHYEIESSGEEREFYIFVSEPEKLDELFLPIKPDIKYIDLIIPAPLLYKTLYTKEILQDNSTHCFVYFTENDASITLYRNGEYLYTKSIEFSLEQIYDKYCEYIGEKIDEKDFFTILESEGLKTSNNDYQQNFMKIFGEIFISINDIIIYAKRAFDLDKIDQMFIGSSRGPIIGLDEYSENYLGLHSSDFNFNYDVNNEEWYTDQYQYMMLLASHQYMEDGSAFVNLTMYPRAPDFINRASGQFIISIISAVSLSLAYPLIFLVGSYANDAKIYTLNIENTKLTSESKKYKGILSKKRSEINGLDSNIKKVSNMYSGKTKTLKAIYDKKINYKLKSGLFHVIAEELDKFDVHIDSLVLKGNTLFLSLVSTDDRKFTELIKYISDTHFDNVKEIDIKTIVKNPENGYYKGILKVVR
jgi:Tfp pilus assembly protein PilN